MSGEGFGDDALFRKMASRLNPACLPESPRVVPQATGAGAGPGAVVLSLESDRARLKRFPTQDYEQLERPSVEQAPSADASPTGEASPSAYI